ncbi:MAG: SulP family inorganic anion transporter [Betaproteobacteria bacterium]|nr:SulP family inorganic anion transporter [Betaproteobacteria bacterium]
MKHAFPFLRWWPMVTATTLRGDFLAALVGAIVVLPQGIAFGILSGVGPEYGLYCAMVPAVVAAFFGSSWHAVSGPTNAVSLFVFATLAPLASPGSPQFISYAFTLAFMSGMLMLAMGLARAGTLVNFISHTVVVGFTAGAGVLIIGSQLRDFLGIDIARGMSPLPAFIESFSRIFEIQAWTFAVAATTVLAGIATRRFMPRFPYMIAAIGTGCLAAALIHAIVGPASNLRMVDAIPASLPPLSSPDFSLETLRSLAGIAIAITVLSIAEAMSIARAVAQRSGQRIDANQEFIGQGMSNIAAGFFSGYPSSASFNRTGLNFEAGAKTPLAAAISAVLLAVIVSFFAPLARVIPMAAVAGLLMMVAWGLVDFKHMRHIVSTDRGETAVLVVTLAATLLLSLEIAILAGVVFSLLIYLHRTSHPALRSLIPDPRVPQRNMLEVEPGFAECPQMKILRIEGSLYFGAIEHVEDHFDQLRKTRPEQKHLLLMSKSINTVDLAGADLLRREVKKRRDMGGDLYFYSLRKPVIRMFEEGGYRDEFGRDHMFRGKREAFNGVFQRLDRSICATCTARIFEECAGIEGPKS